MHNQQETQRATPTLDATNAQWRSTSTIKNQVIPPRATKCRTPVVFHAKKQHMDWDNQVHDFDATATSNLSAIECLGEIKASVREVVTECYRVVMGMYCTSMAVAHLLVQACKLTWALGCLTVVTGRWLWSTGKSLWAKMLE
jgi:hypothetical protein